MQGGLTAGTFYYLSATPAGSVPWPTWPAAAKRDPDRLRDQRDRAAPARRRHRHHALTPERDERAVDDRPGREDGAEARRRSRRDARHVERVYVPPDYDASGDDELRVLVVAFEENVDLFGQNTTREAVRPRVRREGRDPEARRRARRDVAGGDCRARRAERISASR
jgi:hypothetical protein